MSDTNQKIDDKKGDNVLAKMLKTKPKPNSNKLVEKKLEKTNVNNKK